MGVAAYILSIISALGIGAFVKDWQTGRAERKLRLEERVVTRDEKYRDELRDAYAVFIAAHAKLIEAASILRAVKVCLDDASSWGSPTILAKDFEKAERMGRRVH